MSAEDARTQFEGLLDGMGRGLRNAGYAPEDVPRLIAEVREERRPTARNDSSVNM